MIIWKTHLVKVISINKNKRICHEFSFQSDNAELKDVQ